MKMKKIAIILAMMTSLLFASTGCDEAADGEDPSATATEASTETASTTFDVEGMTCVSCAMEIEDKLTEVDGIVEASVDFGEKQATVEYSPSTIDADEILAALEGGEFTDRFEASIASSE